MSDFALIVEPHIGTAREKRKSEMKVNRNSITYERLRDVLHYEHVTGTFTWKETRGRTAVAGQVAGYKRADGYVAIKIEGRQYLAHRLVWLYENGYLPENQIDHINRIRDDNRIINLREVSQTCNLRNAKNRVDNTSGVNGVCWYGKYGKWMARIRIDNKDKYLGIYADFEEAICARLAGEQCVNWTDCDSTSSAYLYVKRMLER